ncbi:Pxmp2 [Symbiodinium sp. CCMP2456]|nr:Pxmp2 [Symbiodinium sp. CCMP2456]
MLLSCKRPEEHALTAAQEASACDADFVEAAAAAIEEAEYRRMPDDVQDQPALKRLRGMIEGPSGTAASSNEGGLNKDEALVRQWAEDLVKSLHGCPSVEQAVQRCSAALTGFGSQDAIIIFALFQFFCVMNSRSILQCLAAWKRVSCDMLEIYGDFAVVQPVLAKSLTSGVAYVLGDLIAQRVEGEPVINIFRCTHNGITGLILHGPILHFWILFLEGPFSQLFSNGDCLLAVVAKVAMDQTLFSATLNAAYALLLGILAGKTLQESMSHMRRTVPPAMFSSWRFWPIVHLVTYSSFMPIQFKVLWNDIAEVVWVAILSYIANVEAMNLNTSKGPSGKQGKVSLSA